MAHQTEIQSRVTQVAQRPEFREFGKMYATPEDPWNDGSGCASIFVYDRWENEFELVIPREGMTDAEIREALWDEIERSSRVASELTAERQAECAALACDR